MRLRVWVSNWAVSRVSNQVSAVYVTSRQAAHISSSGGALDGWPLAQALTSGAGVIGLNLAKLSGSAT
jgi:hypothetical protein